MRCRLPTLQQLPARGSAQAVSAAVLPNPPPSLVHTPLTPQSVLVAMAAALLGWSSWECREGWSPRSLSFHADKDRSFSLCGSAAVPGWKLNHPSLGWVPH